MIYKYNKNYLHAVVVVLTYNPALNASTLICSSHLQNWALPKYLNWYSSKSIGLNAKKLHEKDMVAYKIHIQQLESLLEQPHATRLKQLSIEDETFTLHFPSVKSILVL